MAAGYEDPAVQRRRLRVDLRKLRQDAGFTQRDVAQAMEWSTLKLIRIESGDVGITTNDLKALLAHYGVNEKRRVDSFLEMARAARKESWADFRNVHSQAFLTYLGFESSAWLIRNFEIAAVPGLLQTEEYARNHLAQAYGYSGEKIDRLWESRRRRQELHERDKPPKMFFILDEAAIRRQVGGPGVMRHQLERLRELSTLPHLSLQVVPYQAGAYPGMAGQFLLLEFTDPNDDMMLFLEQGTEPITARDNPEETGPYLDRWFRMEYDIALSKEETQALLDEAIGTTKKAPVPAAAAAGKSAAG